MALYKFRIIIIIIIIISSLCFPVPVLQVQSTFLYGPSFSGPVFCFYRFLWKLFCLSANPSFLPKRTSAIQLHRTLVSQLLVFLFNRA